MLTSNLIIRRPTFPRSITIVASPDQIYFQFEKEKKKKKKDDKSVITVASDNHPISIGGQINLSRLRHDAGEIIYSTVDYQIDSRFSAILPWRLLATFSPGDV